MINLEQKEAYFRYLTERLDNGQSKNVVISTSVSLILQKAGESGGVRVLDVGCFSGAMLNRIKKDVPEEIRNRVQFVGIDENEEVLTLGRKKYQGLTLVHKNLNDHLPDLGEFDVVIVANAIHETIPKAGVYADYEDTIATILAKIGAQMVKGGHLIILDGLKPENDTQTLTLGFTTPEMKDLFLTFAREYRAFSIKSEEITGGFIQTRIRDLAAFLTKARYLQEKYWPIESAQIYQLFTAGQFRDALRSAGFQVEQMDPQMFTKERLEDIFSSVDPEISFPAKNILIVARKT